MAYTCPQDLDGFLPHLGKPDTKFRQTVGIDLLNYLAEQSNSIHCQDIGQLVDGLIPWMQSSNYKVSSNGIEVITYLADRLGTDFRPYLPSVLPAVIDRLGDAKDTVREKAQLLILKLLERAVLNPQQLLEKLSVGFTHKNAKIREEVLRCLINTLNEHGSQSITLHKFVPNIVKLLSDPTASVRDTAFSTIVELYKHIGERLRIDLQRKNIVPASKLPALFARFDEVKEAGELLPSAKDSDFGRGEMDEIDRMVMSKPAIPVKRAAVLSAAAAAASKRMQSAPQTRNASAPQTHHSNSKAEAGAMDEDTFLRAFEDVPLVQIFSNRELTEQMNAIRDIISDSTKDWNKRVDALKKLRSLLIGGASGYEDFLLLLRKLEFPLQATVKDLRSQVVREACITISYYSQSLKSKFEHTAELLLPVLINLIQNSAKIMATAGHCCVRFIIQNIQSPRLVPIITHNLVTHKSKDIRRSCCEFLETMLTQWSVHSLERHLSLLQDALRKGVADADPEARVCSRRAFRAFKEHFPDQADILLQSLDSIYRKALYGELCLSSSSSSGSLAQTSTGFRTPRTATAAAYRPHPPTSATGSIENLCQNTCAMSGFHRVPSLPRSYQQRSAIPVLNNKDNSSKQQQRSGGFRSNSAIDLQAAQRAKVRAQYAAMNRQKITSGTASLHGEMAQQARAKKHVVEAMASPERTGRTRSRSSGVSQSQPTSRSGSPSSRLSYATYGRLNHDSPRPRRLSSGIPRSTTVSRETSPNRSPVVRGGSIRGSGCSTTNNHHHHHHHHHNRPPLSPARPVMAQKILQQSLEAESALADAFVVFEPLDSGDFNRFGGSARKTLRSLDNHSDDSETSSVCSERSLDSPYRRTSGDSYSWSGSQQKLAREPCRDISEIINSCASTVWQERKEGLVSLQCYLNGSDNAALTKSELKMITDIFTKMFMDSHTKVLSLFLDTLNELIMKHYIDLNDWLYVLLQRIFNKLGTEILSSLYKKLYRTLDVIRTYFPYELQFLSICRFLVDNTQTPNTKVKVAVLNYLKELVEGGGGAEEDSIINQPPANQALAKIIQYSQDSKSVEVRSAAKTCLITLFNSNTAQVTIMLAELPPAQQEIAAHIVQSHLHKTTEPFLHNDINHEDVYKSLQRTTAEIQNYSFEALGISKLERDRNTTTSQDSGISQMSAGATTRTTTTTNIEEQVEQLNLNSNSNAACSLNIINGSSDFEPTIESSETIGKMFELDMMSNIDHLETRKVLTHLLALIKNKHAQLIIENFKKLLKILLNLLKLPDSKIQMLVLLIITEIFKTEELNECYIEFVELLVIKILCAHKDQNKEVVRYAEQCAASMTICPFDQVVRVLSPMITTAEYPVNQGAIKMMTKLVEQHSSEISDQHLMDIMPKLIQAYDHDESPMRKCAVFCMVAIHTAVGEERIAPYLQHLVGSKRKLLHLYVERAQQGSSVPTSPKNSATS